MSYFSPIPPGERIYADNYRVELEPFEAELVEVSGRVKEFRDHDIRTDLQSLLLVNLTITPLPRARPKRSIKLPHLWVLTKYIRRAGVDPKRNRRIVFIGTVYAYYRLGGKSRERGLLGSHDFSILPLSATDIKNFQPGLQSRYEIKDKTTNGGHQRRNDIVGESSNF